MDNFVDKKSIVRKIWSNPDVILFIFAGAAAEFSVNKAVDWLYFTGKLPADPLGRLFSTVGYAQKIVFSTVSEAHAAIDQISAIHQHVEMARKSQIPDWAYRDVLFMLIAYAISAFEQLERKLEPIEQEEVFQTFYRVGTRMKINGLPTNLYDWQKMREKQLSQNLVYGKFSADLFKQYRKHLGFARYLLLRQIQALMAPKEVNILLELKEGVYISCLLKLYKKSKKIGMQQFCRKILLPNAYQTQINNLKR